MKRGVASRFVRRCRIGMVIIVLLFGSSGLSQSPEVQGILEKFQCYRCHEMDFDDRIHHADLNCVSCHQSILLDRYNWNVSTQTKQRWKSRIRSLIVTPKLSFKKKRLRKDWLKDYFNSPVPIRPHLGATMPRLNLTEEEASALALALGVDTNEELTTPPRFSPSSLEKGNQLFQQLGCNSCHDFTDDTKTLETEAKQQVVPIRKRMAPDLRYTRNRLTYDYTKAFLKSRALRAEYGMPDFELNDDEVQSLVDYVFYSSVSSSGQMLRPYKPKLLQREVRFNEVNDRIFDKVCRHCHFDPKINQLTPGDGGPGGTGGFGFNGKGIYLNSFEAVTSDRTLKLILGKDSDGISLIVRSLIDRHLEHNGIFKRDILGMPLGLFPIPPDDIDLLHTWIEQGAKK